MTERGILFGAPMVRAILDGSKTQTRRLISPQPYMAPTLTSISDVRGGFFDYEGNAVKCPYGLPGDRLWVREAHSFVPDDEEPAGYSAILYAADGEQCGKVRAGRFMPRFASRILLGVVSVRVERLQGISEADAVAEGIGLVTDHMKAKSAYGMYYCRMPDEKIHYSDSAVDLYKTLWEQINGTGSWEANPWVWVVEFRRIES